ncbi:MAG: DUF4065 domain-containing protein [Clostridiales bacterium]|jgi:uncharacterized phage-associated protein|nr:DUF4065 domain-containing protein [Clostridiales bacterium]
MFTSLHVANNVLHKAFRDHEKITPMKLQKLLYFIYREYLIATQIPLFSERFQAWQYGPVLGAVYTHFKRYHSHGIKKYYEDSEGNVYLVDEDCDEHLKRALNLVWGKYHDWNGIELSELTHKEGTAWYNAVKYRKLYLDDKDIINEGALV